MLPAAAPYPYNTMTEDNMTDRIQKARTAIEAVVTRYCGVHGPHVNRALPPLLDEFHNAVVEAVLDTQRALADSSVQPPTLDVVLTNADGAPLLSLGEVVSAPYEATAQPADLYAVAATRATEFAKPEVFAGGIVPTEPEVLSGCAVRAEAQREAVAADEAPKGGRRYRK